MIYPDIFHRNLHADQATEAHIHKFKYNPEIIKVYRAWKNHCNLEPCEYLYNKKLTPPISADIISRHNIEDFKNKNIIDIHGLILGETETAIVLSLYFN
jgi:hypothetical protein